jgi:hypothetical protein
LYDSIRFAKSWENICNWAKRVEIAIDTSPEISLCYDSGDSSVIYHIKEVMNYKDSVILKTTSYGNTEVYIWTLKNVVKNKGIWAISKPQLYKILGTYIDKSNKLDYTKKPESFDSGF